MIIDHRTYTFHPLKMAKWLKLYQEKGLPVQYKYLGQPLAMYRTGMAGLSGRGRSTERAAPPGKQVHLTHRSATQKLKATCEAQSQHHVERRCGPLSPR